ncbi:hypothetical protein GCM10027040_27560 [Halomonas shantousis]
MKGFRKYQSKPITRLAYQVQPNSRITKVGEATWRIEIADKQIDFKAYEPVMVGDYIVYLNDQDVYHCNAKVFAERNVVE